MDQVEEGVTMGRRRRWRAAAGSLLAWLLPCPASLAAVAWSWGVFIGVVVPPADEPPAPDAPAGPPPGHPERLATDLPVTDVERELWASLGH
ncbi:DUF6059 family protein [Streptomyces sp. NPDC001037]|uniref:DUF6059 family protein n=1 Tax=Streptomyces sp. NPDC001037 TaxID=3364542 RepID=UPI0036AE98CD